MFLTKANSGCRTSSLVSKIHIYNLGLKILISILKKKKRQHFYALQRNTGPANAVLEELVQIRDKTTAPPAGPRLPPPGGSSRAPPLHFAQFPTLDSHSNFILQLRSWYTRKREKRTVKRTWDLESEDVHSSPVPTMDCVTLKDLN